MILLDNLPKLSQNILPISGFITRDSPMSSGIHMVRTAYQRCTVFLDRRPLRMCHRCITVIFKTVICRKFNIMLSQNRYQLTDPVLFQATMDFSDFCIVITVSPMIFTVDHTFIQICFQKKFFKFFRIQMFQSDSRWIR